MDRSRFFLGATVDVLGRVRQAITIAGDATDTLVVVIDNADCVSEPGAVDALLDLIEQVPALHLVVCSRFGHPLRAAAEARQLDL